MGGWRRVAPWTQEIGGSKGGGSKGGGSKGGGSKGGGPTQKKWEPEEWGPKGGGGWEAQNFALFFPSPAAKLVLFIPPGGLLVEFWLCLKRRGAQTCTFEGPVLQKHHQNSKRRP